MHVAEVMHEVAVLEAPGCEDDDNLRSVGASALGDPDEDGRKSGYDVPSGRRSVQVAPLDVAGPNSEVPGRNHACGAADPRIASSGGGAGDSGEI